jgi:hypothetical protein
VDLRQMQAGIALTGAADGTLMLTLPAGKLLSAEASGPGKTGGPFVATAGHGLMGDLMDLQSAEWLNGRYGTIRTLVRIQATTCELFLTTGSSLPEAAQVALSPVRAMAPSSTAAVTPPASLLDGLTGTPAAAMSPGPAAGPAALTRETTFPPGSGLTGGPGEDDDLVSRLERLAKLRETGAITQFEFQAAKDKLLH